MGNGKPISEGQKQLNEKLVAEVTDALYQKAERENLDADAVNSAVKDVQDIFSGRAAKRKQCFLCEN